MKLSKKLKEYGKNVLSAKPSAKADRKKKRAVRRLRKTVRARQKVLNAGLDEQLEKDRILQEYLSSTGEQA